MSRKTLLTLIVVITAIVPCSAEAQPAPPTARQALLEMFFSKTPGTFAKHLPDELLAVIKKSNSGPNGLATLGLLTSQIQASGQQVQTYEAGPILVSAESQATNSKLEVMVERDDLNGEEDEIEVSFRAYKDGQLQNSGMSPRLVFGMKQETGVWRVNDFTFSFKLSLTDPELLKSIEKWQAAAAASANAHPTVTMQTSPQNFNESSAVVAMRSILRAETTYANTYGHGYTCSLSDLGGIGGDETNDHHARLIDPGLASGKKHGYRFALGGCSGNPAAKFALTAVPSEGSFGQAFCSDESAVIRSSGDGNGQNCLNGGRPLP